MRNAELNLRTLDNLAYNPSITGRTSSTSMQGM